VNTPLRDVDLEGVSLLDERDRLAFYQNIAMIKIEMPRRAPQQLSFRDHRLHSGWGGPRKGAGRKPAPRPIVHHVRRPRVPRDCPSHAVSARIARAVNRVFRSKGPVLAGRYHLRVLRAPR
jgi:hypothetical protein